MSESENKTVDIYEESIKSLKELLDVQCSDGNWNHDPYMHGMANGMILALSLFEGGRPEYLEAPKEWGKDKPDLSKPVTETSLDDVLSGRASLS